METTAKNPFNTVRDYFEDTYSYDSTAKILDIQEPVEGAKDNLLSIITDRTIFHPQGGGQPHDKGHIIMGDVKFVVEVLKHEDDAILHRGNYAEGAEQVLKVGDEVKLQINGEFRSMNAKIHSAGHLLDMAMNRAGRTDLKPGKGYHFVEGPYVEYIGKVDPKEVDGLIAELNKHCSDLIQEARDADTKVFRKICSYEEAGQELKGAGGVPDYIKEGQELRVLKLTPEDLGCPCGGTHVHAIPEIGRVEVVKMKKKKGNTQVSYKVHVE
jgi:Ser-tRNA(Ala) deacylase AlaX